MKILAVCGSGLGSSFMLSMNIQEVLQELGVAGITVEHSDLSSVTPDMADFFVMGKDIAEGALGLTERTVILDSIIDRQELIDKLRQKLSELGKL
ncbi:PTS sugar transporter subunit IIB [Bacillus sp. N9]